VLEDIATYSAYALAPRAVDFLLAGDDPSVASVVGNVVQVAFKAVIYGVKDYETAAFFLDNFNALFETAEVGGGGLQPIGLMAWMQALRSKSGV